MKKIMFNDKYGLTRAVLEGRKTQTRRIIKLSHVRVPDCFKKPTEKDLNFIIKNLQEGPSWGIELCAPYAIGEEVAIAQPYDEVWDFVKSKGKDADLMLCANLCIGAKNKFWVKAGLMPNHIRITNLRIERLKDISDEDCLKEGVKTSNVVKGYWYFMGSTTSNDKIRRESARMAYADLIDKICGRGTWDNNPYVFVYDFELVK